MGLTDISSPSTVNIALPQIAEEAGLLDVVEEIVAFGMGDKDILTALMGEMQDAMVNVIETWSGLEPTTEFNPLFNRPMFEEILHRMLPGQVYAALKLDVIRELVEKVGNRAGTRVMPLKDLRKSLDEDGPVQVVATRDSGSPQYVTVTWTPPPTVEVEGVPTAYHSELYVDLVRVWAGDAPEVDEMSVLGPITVPSGNHSIRVLYVHPESGSATRFGQVAYIS